MADLTEISNQISNGAEAISEFKTMVSNLSPVISSATEMISKLGSGFKNLSNDTNKSSDSANQNDTIFSKLNETTKKVTKTFFTAVEANKELVRTGIDVLLTLQMISKGTVGAGLAMDDYSKHSEFANKANIRFADSAVEMSKKMGEAAEKRALQYKSFISIISEVKTFENAIMSAAQTGGNFFNVYADGGKDMVSQNENVMNKVANQAFTTANILGIHFEDANKLVVSVMKNLPGEFGKIYDDILIGTTKYSLTTEQILGKVTRGTSVSLEDGLSIANKMLYKFGENAVDSAKRIAVLNKANKQLGMQFSDVKGLADDLDNSFSMWGNQLDGIIPILNDVSEALKGTNVGIEGQIKLVKSLGDSAEKMSLPMRSFIGTMSGMRSAGGSIGVGLNVERMLQEGKSGEVISMMQETMQRMTGRQAISLKEATDDPRSQTAFLTQRKLLEKMTGSGDTGQLNRILEVMSKGELGTSGMIDAQKALSGAMQTGEDIATKQTDIMVTLSENLSALEKTLVATNKLYKAYVTKTSADDTLMKNTIVEQGLARQAGATETFAQQSLEGEAVTALSNRIVTELAGSIATGTKNQVAMGAEIIGDLAGDLKDAIDVSSVKDLEIMKPIMSLINEASESSGVKILDTIKTNYEKLFPKLSGKESKESITKIVLPKAQLNEESSMKAMEMPSIQPTIVQPELTLTDPTINKKLEYEPLKVMIDLNIKDNNGNVSNDSYELSSEIMRIIPRSGGRG